MHTLMQLAVFVVAAAPGYFIAAAMMGTMGRKSIQIIGFAMMAVSAAIVSVLGIIITVTMLPETKGKSLEELSAEERGPVPAST